MPNECRFDPERVDEADTISLLRRSNPTPVPMPAEVVRRIDLAIAQESERRTRGT